MDKLSLSPATLLRGVQFEMRAPQSGHLYRIQVCQPDAPAPPEGYPALFLTDGAVTFPPAATQMMLRAGSELRPGLIVGVGYADAELKAHEMQRVRDLTPPTPKEHSIFGDAETGGAEAFASFIIDHLRPRIAGHWPMNLCDQTLFGHSLGGLFALSVYARRPESFQRYVPSSPSIWWNQGAILPEIEALLTQQLDAARAAKLMLMAGDLEETASKAFAGVTEQAVAALQTYMDTCAIIRRAEALSQRLSNAGVSAPFIRFAQEGHGSVIPAAVTRALQFAFAYPSLAD